MAAGHSEQPDQSTSCRVASFASRLRCRATGGGKGAEFDDGADDSRRTMILESVGLV